MYKKYILSVYNFINKTIDSQETSLGVEDPRSRKWHSPLENSMDRGAWWATAHGISESDMTERAHTQNLKLRYCLYPINILHSGRNETAQSLGEPLYSLSTSVPGNYKCLFLQSCIDVSKQSVIFL